MTYTWSGDGIRRSAATGTGAATTNFLVDRNVGLPEIALERDGTGTLLRTYTYGLERISVINASGGIAYEHPDGLGSVTDLVSSSGVALGWTDYGPYGAIRSAGALAGVPADPFGFTGAYLDGTTGLYHLRARQYDPATGRFLSTDPAGRSATDPYVAAYVYANANPVRYTDPSGRESQPALAPRLVRPSPSHGAGGGNCPGAAFAGALALGVLAVLDVGVGVANVFVDWSIVGALALAPVDVGMTYATGYMISMTNQATQRPCGDIHLSNPVNPFGG